MQALGHGAGQFGGFHPRHAQHAGRHGAYAPQAALLEVPGHQDAADHPVAQGVGGHAAVAQAEHQHVPLGREQQAEHLPHLFRHGHAVLRGQGGQPRMGQRPVDPLGLAQALCRLGRINAHPGDLHFAPFLRVHAYAVAHAARANRALHGQIRSVLRHAATLPCAGFSMARRGAIYARKKARGHLRRPWRVSFQPMISPLALNTGSFSR